MPVSVRCVYEFHRLINLILISRTTFNNVYPIAEWRFIKIDLSVKQKSGVAGLDISSLSVCAFECSRGERSASIESPLK